MIAGQTSPMLSKNPANTICHLTDIGEKYYTVVIDFVIRFLYVILLFVIIRYPLQEVNTKLFPPPLFLSTFSNAQQKHMRL